MRDFNEFIARIGDVIGLPLLTLLLILAAVITGLLWAFWDPFTAMLARMLRWRRGGKKETQSDGDIRLITEEILEEVEASEEELPQVPAAVFLTLADRYASQGRYAEAVRERLRAMVRRLVDGGVILHHPGWTVTELADAAGNARPGVKPPVLEASGIFSTIWYRKEPALSDHDTRMRALADSLEAEMSRR
jgi:hypothetical protein